MSGGPRRSHEETDHSFSKYRHESAATYSRLPSSTSNEYHVPCDMVQDSRVTKMPRIESCDVDRSSPIHSMYRMPSSSNDSHVDLWFEDCGMKPLKEFHADVIGDSQNSRTNKDAPVEVRGDDSKDAKYDWDSHNDSEGDLQTEKDKFGVVSSHLSCKGSKENQKGKGYSEVPSGSLDSWPISCGSLQAIMEAGKDRLIAGERDYMEAHAVARDSKVDPISEDRSEENDRKRKDVKRQDWGQTERSKHRSSTPGAYSSGECIDPADENRDAERWVRDKRDLREDKGNLREGKESNQE